MYAVSGVTCEGFRDGTALASLRFDPPLNDEVYRLTIDGASVREEVEIGEETIVGRAVSIENRCRIGARVKIETGAYITGLSQVGDDCFIAPMVTTSNDNFVGRTEERFQHFGGVVLERGARVGAGSTILPGKRTPVLS